MTVEDGLSQGFVSSIVQDNNGYMWAGTINGLNRYDGYQFKTYRHHANNPYSVSSDEIRTLATDNTGRMWVVTSAGIQYYNTSKDNFETPGILAAQNTVNTTGVWINADKLLLADRERIRVFRISGTESDKILEPEKDIPIRSEYRALGTLNCLLYKDGSVWAGTYDGVFEISDDGLFSRVLPEIRASIYQLWFDELHSQICIQTNSCVLFTDGTRILYKIHVPEMNYGSGMSGKKMGDKYVVLAGKAAWLWDGKELISTGINFDKKIASGYVDRQENLWIGFDGAGLICLKKRDKLVKRVIREGISASKKPVIAEDGSIWLYSQIEGSWAPEYSAYSKYGKSLGRKRLFYHIENGKEGKTWAVNNHSQLAFIDSNGTETEVRNPDPGKLHVTFGITVLPDGRLMLLSANRFTIQFYDPEAGVLFGVPDADRILRHSDKSVNQVSVGTTDTSDGYQIWLSGELGVIRLEPDWGKRTCKVMKPGETFFRETIKTGSELFSPNLIYIHLAGYG